MSEFPNFLMLFGPNSTTLWGSAIYSFEMQARYNRLVVTGVKKRCQDGKKFAMMPDSVAEKRYNALLQPGLDKLSMSPKFGCGSYYTNGRGQNTIAFPFHQLYFRWLTRRIKWEDYVILEKEEGANAPELKRTK